MRIRKISVRSFGPISGRELTVSPGFTVVFGPNGCGKTSLAEFIGTCLVPTEGRDRYPSRSKDDSGFMIMHVGDSETTVTVKGRSRFGRVPDCVKGVSPELFRKLFSVGRDSLLDLSILSSADEGESGRPSVRRSAKAMKEVEARSFGLQPGDASDLDSIEREIAENDAAIESLYEEVRRFGEYRTQRDAIANRIRFESDTSLGAGERKRYDELMSERQAEYGRLAELSAARKELGEFEWAGSSDKKAYEELRKELEEAREELESMEGYLEGPMNELGDRKPSSVLFYSDDITWLANGRRDYEHQMLDLRRSRSRLAEARMGASGRQRRGGIFGIPDRSGDESGLTEAISDLARRTEAYERMVSRITAGLGIGITETAHAVTELVRLRDAASIVSKHGDELKHARLREETAAKAMDEFAARFDGLENFAECLDKTESAKRIDAETSDIRACLARDGLDPDAPVCPAEYIGVADGAAGLERKLEELDSRIARIMGSEELDALLDRRSVLATRRAAVLRRGVEAMLACAIARKIDARALDLLPMELDSAGSILSEMTGSECSLRYEGRFMLSVEGEERPLSEAGDGMRALASLALKVSAAEMIGEGKVPLVLDEVLAGLDPRTKASACRALRGAAKRMQVILLTADQETRDMLAGMPDVTLVTLPLPHKQRDREGPDGMDAGRE